MLTLKTSTRRWRAFLVGSTAISITLLISLSVVGCGPVLGSDPEADRAEAEAAIRAYLPALADAYATGNIVPLKKLAVPKEILRIRARADELADRGRIYEPTFKDLTIENFKIWQHANAIVTTQEIWDVRSYAMGSRTLLGEVIDQRNRVQYQLKRKEHGWVVLYRELAEDPNANT